MKCLTCRILYKPGTKEHNEKEPNKSGVPWYTSPAVSMTPYYLYTECYKNYPTLRYVGSARTHAQIKRPEVYRHPRGSIQEFGCKSYPMLNPSHGPQTRECFLKGLRRLDSTCERSRKTGLEYKLRLAFTSDSKRGLYSRPERYQVCQAFHGS